jgi:hypothetical protein
MTFSEAGSGDIEAMLEQSVKGSVALTREVLPALRTSGGFLGMVLPHRIGGSQGPLDALAEGAFAGFGGAVIRETDPSVWACGFASSSPDAEGFTSAVLEKWDERPANYVADGTDIPTDAAPSAVRESSTPFSKGKEMKAPYRYLIGIGSALPQAWFWEEAIVYFMRSASLRK